MGAGVLGDTLGHAAPLLVQVPGQRIQSLRYRPGLNAADRLGEISGLSSQPHRRRWCDLHPDSSKFNTS
jgi:hypothetical protein